MSPPLTILFCHTNKQRRRYNTAVLTIKSGQDAAARHHRHAVYASETTGLLLVAVVLLVLTLIRYGHQIPWSLR